MPDVIVLTETWIQKSNLPNFKLKGYVAHIEERSLLNTGGVACYIKDCLTANVKSVSGTTYDALWLELPKNELHVLALYRFTKANMVVFFQELEGILSCNDDNVVLTGDLNIDITRSEDHNSVNYLNMLESEGFECLLNEPTRFFRDQMSCLDHFFLKKQRQEGKIFETKCIVHNYGLTDHRPTSLTLKYKSPLNTEPTVCEIIDYCKIKEYVGRVDWDEVVEMDDVELAFKVFSNKLREILEKSKKTITSTPKCRIRNNWASNTLANLSREKERLYRLLKKNPSRNDIREQYKMVSKSVVQRGRLERKNHHSKILDSFGDDPKKYWNHVKKIKGDKKAMIQTIEINGIKYSTPQHTPLIANNFNSYFSEIAENLCKSSLVGSIQNSGPEKILSNSFQFHEINTIETFNVIKSLKSKPSVGIDLIPARAIRENAEILAAPLTTLFNRSLLIGLFPSVLKKAVVVPIFKSGDNTLMNNYRPIALLPVLSKILEKLVKRRMLDFLQKYNFFDDKQYGFLPKNNTENALFDLIGAVTDGLERGKKIAVVFIDLRKAFDTVRHNILLEKLNNGGFRGFFLNWLKSYLLGRQQAVKITGILSEFLDIESGVPQGSVLGPFLFLIYINDIFKLNLSGSLFAFADDIAIVYEAWSVSKLTEKINGDLTLLKKWFTEHKLVPNLQKSEIMAFGYREIPDLRNRCVLHEEIGCKENCQCPPLNQVKSVKYLGVILDEKLIWDKHSAFLQTKLRKLNGLLYYLSGFFSTYHLKKIYYALFDSVLKYGVTTWGGMADQHMQPIRVLQKRAIRHIVGLKRTDSTKTSFKKLKILTVEESYKFALATLVHKRRKNFKVGLANREGLRESNYKAVLPRYTTSRAQMQITFQAPKFYNMVPLDIRKKGSLHLFRKYAKKWLLEGLVEPE